MPHEDESLSCTQMCDEVQEIVTRSYEVYVYITLIAERCDNTGLRTEV